MKANMLEYLEETAKRLPDKTAFYDDHEKMTFAALLETAQSIGSRLAETAAPRQPVALIMDPRSIRNIPAMFGALYAGCAYAPLDIAMPPERLRLLLDLCSPPRCWRMKRGARRFRAAA